MTSQLVSPTPASDRTIYFDAPIAIFGQPETQVNNMSDARTSPDLDRPVNGDAAPTRENTVSGPRDTNSQTEHSPLTMHPNGSEGWLPAADVDDGEEPNALGSPKTGVLRRNTLANRAPSRATSTRSRGSQARAQSIGGVSLGRKSIFSNADGRPVSGSTFINGAGTTGPSASAEADESLAERSAIAEGALSAKQQSRIKKNEGAYFSHFLLLLLLSPYS